MVIYCQNGDTFQCWAAANGETIDEATQQIVSLALRYLESGTLVAGAFSIALFVLLLVTKKRKNKAK
jgi:hypothetical protein